MTTSFDGTICRNLKAALGNEWLETNGLGGYASSTIIGANTRRFHGLLVVPVAAAAPVQRQVLLSKFEERVELNGSESHLCTNLYPGTVFPHGFNIQTEFRPQPWPTFRYADTDFEIEKSVCLVHGENTLVLTYRNLSSRGPLELRVRPLLAFRPHNRLPRRRAADVNMAVERGDGVLSLHPCAGLPQLHFHARPDTVNVKADWYYRFTYPIEQDRGLDYEEDLFTAFEMGFRLAEGDTVHIVVTTGKPVGINAADLLARERQRREQLGCDRDPARQALQRAAAAFLVRRANGRTVVAGYPWHTDSGRVAMIALPGLTLATGQLDEAGTVLQTFAGHYDRGLIPVWFDEETDKPEYNSVDAALWFVVAVWRWWQAGADKAAVRELLPTARDIIRAYRDGTRFEIYADKDSLLTAGGVGTQLTWMDVKSEGYVPTPRHGKPVEINALWLNALLMLAEMEEKLVADIQAAVILRRLADRVAASFVKAFWFAEGGYLCDVIQGTHRETSIRPNQIFAVSLPFTPLTAEQQKSVFDVVTQHLLTPYGLRTLSPRHEKYCGRHTGNRRQRDHARHQGTVWPWLIGAYCDAYLRVHGDGKPQRKEIARLLQPLLAHLADSSAGSVAELFDGDPPHRTSGCIASAWAVGELLRAYAATK